VCGCQPPTRLTFENRNSKIESRFRNRKFETRRSNKLPETPLALSFRAVPSLRSRVNSGDEESRTYPVFRAGFPSASSGEPLSDRARFLGRPGGLGMTANRPGVRRPTSVPHRPDRNSGTKPECPLFSVGLAIRLPSLLPIAASMEVKKQTQPNPLRLSVLNSGG